MLRSLRLLVLFVALPALAKHVVFVDNSRGPGGDGSPAAPFSSINAAGRAEVIYVAQTATPYVESLTLQKGQMLVGSAYGLDALRAEMKTDFDGPAAPAQQGTGPVIRGTIAVMGDNVVAGCTLVVDRSSSGIVSSAGMGTLAIRGVVFKTMQRSFAVVLQEHHGPVSIVGGGVEATGEGSGLLVTGGDGDVMIERFPMSGAFGTVVRISDRTMGAVTFRNGASIRAEDAADDAIVVTNMAVKAPVTFADRMQIHGRRRGLVASNVVRLIVSGGDSWLATTGGAALDVRNCGTNVVFDSVSSDGAAEGVVIDKVRGKLEVTGVNGKAESGGIIRGAKNYGLRVTQSSNVRFANMTISGSGSVVPAAAPATSTAGRVAAARPQAKCAGEFDVNTTAPCNAALYLRHLENASFENILIFGGGAMGLNANNVRDVKFENLEVRGAGDESFEAGALLQEIGGLVQFTRCRFADNAGSEVMIEQRYNHARVTFDRCAFVAPLRPMIAPRLVDVHALGGSALEVEIRGGELGDNAGAAVEATASGTAALGLTIADSIALRLGTGGVTMKASDAAHATLVMTRVQIVAPAAPGVVDVDASGAASICVELAGNAFTAGMSPIRLAGHGSRASLRVVTNAAGAGTLANALAAANGGAAATIDVPSSGLVLMPDCR